MERKEGSKRKKERTGYDTTSQTSDAFCQSVRVLVFQASESHSSEIQLVRDGPTDGPTDQWTETPSYREARKHLKGGGVQKSEFLINDFSANGHVVYAAAQFYGVHARAPPLQTHLRARNCLHAS